MKVFSLGSTFTQMLASLQAIDENTNELEIKADTVIMHVDDLEDYTRPSNPAVTSGPSLATPGDTSTAFDSSLNSNHTITFNITNIDTDVTLRVEGSSDGSSFRNIAADGQDVVYTTNGVYSLSRSNYPVQNLRLIMVSENGGTNVTISNIKYQGGN